MSANHLQYRLIVRFAHRCGMDAEQAAAIWIPQFAVHFRELFTLHMKRRSTCNL